MQEDYKLEIKSAKPFETKSFMLSRFFFFYFQLFYLFKNGVLLIQEDYKLKMKSTEPFETKSFMLSFYCHLFYLFEKDHPFLTKQGLRKL